MSKVLVSSSTLTDIADSIREKLGVSETFTPSQMGNTVKKFYFGPKIAPRFITLAACSAEARSTTFLSLDWLDTSNLTTLSNMFASCYGLKSIDLSKFRNVNTKGMAGTFYYCKSLTSLDASVLDVSNVTSMYETFYACENLTSLNVSNWNTSKVTNMMRMLSQLKSIETLDLSSFTTASVTNMQQMFAYCTALTHWTYEISLSTA